MIRSIWDMDVRWRMSWTKRSHGKLRSSSIPGKQLLPPHIKLSPWPKNATAYTNPQTEAYTFLVICHFSGKMLYKTTPERNSFGALSDNSEIKRSTKDKTSEAMFTKPAGLWVAGNSWTSPGEVVCTLWCHSHTAGTVRAGQKEMFTVFFSFPSPLVLPDVLITEERERMILAICLHSTQINLLAVPCSSVALRLSHRNWCCRA